MALLPLSPTSPEFGKLKTSALALMSQKVWTPAAVVALGGSLAAEANRLVALSGLQKKQLVIDVIKVVLDEAVVKSIDLSGSPLASKEGVAALNFVLESVLPASLDLAVAAARGQLDLKKVKASVFSGFLACLPVGLGLCGVSREQAQLAVSAVESVAKQVDPSLSEKSEPEKPESYISNPLAETHEKKVSQDESDQQKNSPSVGVVIRVPEGAAQSNPPISESS